MVIPELALPNLHSCPQFLPCEAFGWVQVYQDVLHNLSAPWWAHIKETIGEGEGEVALPCLTDFVDKNYQQINSGIFISFYGSKTRYDLDSLPGPIPLTGERQQLGVLKGVLCYSGTHQSNLGCKKGGPANWLLDDTRRAMGGRGTIDWMQTAHNT